MMEVKDAPSEAQSINIEKWKKERNKEMAELQTTYMFDDKGRRRNVSVKDVDSFKEQGWKEIDEVGKAKNEPIKPEIKSEIKSVVKPEVKKT